MGDGDGDIPGCHGHRQGGVFQYAPARRLHGDQPAARARTSSRTSAASPTTPATSRTCSRASRRWAKAAAASSSSSRSMTRALGADGQPPPAENQGFLRDDAYLGIIFITNEDDCSARRSAFDCRRPTPSLDVAARATGSFRCNEFGHICDGGASPSRLAPNNAGDRHGQLPELRVGRRQRRAEDRRRHGGAYQGAQARSAARSWSAAITGPEGPYQVRLEGTASRVTTDAVARGRALVHGRRTRATPTPRCA